MKSLTLFLSIATSLFLSACGNNTSNDAMEISEENITITSDNLDNQDLLERKLVKEGRIEFETKNLNDTRNQIIEATNKYQGFISSEQEYKMPEKISNIMVIRIPYNQFDNFISDVTKDVYKLDNKEISTNDVTEEFIDIQARLKTKKELELRYIDLLKQTKDVNEILEIEKQIGRLRSEIESIEGRIKFLQDKIAFSTLTISFYQEIPNHTDFILEFKNSFRKGWYNLIWMFVVLTNFWPFILLGLGFLYLTRLIKSRKKP